MHVSWKTIKTFFVKNSQDSEISFVIINTSRKDTLSHCQGEFILSLSPPPINKALTSPSFKVCLLRPAPWKRPASCVRFNTEHTRRPWKTLWSGLPSGIKSDKLFLLCLQESLWISLNYIQQFKGASDMQFDSSTALSSYWLRLTS